jgi:polar amino acid transport system permease protein
VSVIGQNLPLFLTGLLYTLRIAALTLAASTLIGVVLGTLAVTRSTLVRRLVRFYVEVLRAIPLIVNLFFVYFGAPLLGLDLSPYAAVVLGLSLWGGANGAEIVRGGLQGVPRHQSESARALGLREWEIFVFVVFPQALRSILPAFAGLLTLLVQSTSLGALVGVPEFFKVGNLVVERSTVMQGLDPAFGVYGFVLAIYFILCSALTFATRRLERRLGATARRRAPLAAAVPGI